MAEHDVEQVWHDFWLPIMDDVVSEDPNYHGQTISVPWPIWEQVKRELYDFHRLVKDLPAFFDDITGGQLTKPNTDLKIVAEIVQERKQEAYDEGFGDGYGDASAACWQDGYNDGHEDGRESGFDAGLDEARRRI